MSDEVKLLSSMTLAGDKSQTLLKPVRKISHLMYEYLLLFINNEYRPGSTKLQKLLCK